MQKVRKAVFPVAGLGTRVLPATKVLPKEMLILVDKPLIQYAVEEARSAGIEQFCFVSAYGKEILERHFDTTRHLEEMLQQRGKLKELELARAHEIPAGQLYVTQQRTPKGLGHAIWCAKEFIGNEPFAIILPDDVVLAKKPCLAQMVEAYQETGGNMVAVVDVPKAETKKYGILDIAEDKGTLVSVKGLVEKPEPEVAPSTLSIIGRYILQPQVLDYLGQHEIGAGGEIQLTDSMAKLIGSQPFHGVRYEGLRYDCGSAAGLLEANVAFALARPDLNADVRARLTKLLQT